MLKNDLNAQVSDTTGDDSSNAVCQRKIKSLNKFVDNSFLQSVNL